MGFVEIPDPKAPKRVDRESARQLHINWIKQLEGAFEARTIAALRAVLRNVASGLDNLVAQGAPGEAGEPFVSLDDLTRIGTGWDETVAAKLLPDMADAYLAGAQGVGLSMTSSATVIPEVVNREGIDWLQQSSNRLRGIGDDAWQSVRTELVVGMQQGESIDELQRRVRASIDVVESRARMIARTEVVGATNAGSYAQAVALGAETKTWLATEDSRTRPTHHWADNQAVPMDEFFEVGGFSLRFPHDPYGPPGETINCYTGDTLVECWSPIRKIFRRWYEGEIIRVYLADSMEIAGTPNHPVLTIAGWKPLQFIDRMDKVVGTIQGKRMGAGFPLIDHRPSTFAELYHSITQTGSHDRVCGRCVDFHGDGTVNGEIDVVRTHGDLLDPVFRQPLSNSLLAWLCELASFLSDGRGEMVFSEAWDSIVLRYPNPFSHSRRQGSALLERHLVKPSQMRIAKRPDEDLSSHQASPDYATTHLVGIRDALFGFASEITAHDVVDVQRDTMSHWVYNLETVGGWYSSNSIISHNCRCTLLFDETPLCQCVPSWAKESLVAAGVPDCSCSGKTP